VKLEIAHPCWLIGIGDTERVEVLRSPLVREHHKWMEPVRRFIGDHGLVLAVRETFSDSDWMFGQVEVSVYVPPAVRNGVLAGTELSLPWFASAALLKEKHD
jgi:Gene product 70